MSRLRLVQLVLAFACATALIVGYLFQLTVVEHESWLERSYLNRWAFRDTPTRRGSLFDRGGRALAWDVPGFDLELVYWQFRREHPVGAAVHGANLISRARHGHDRFQFTSANLQGAFDALVSVPVAWLGDDDSAWLRVGSSPRYRDDPRLVGVDVRFYCASVLSRLSGVPRRTIGLHLGRAARMGVEGTVLDVLSRTPDLADVRFTRSAFVDAVERLRELEAKLAGHDEPGATARVRLTVELERRRRDWRQSRVLDAFPPAERRVLSQSSFWRFLYQVSRIADWHEWSTWPESVRVALLDAYDSLSDRTREALADWQPDPSTDPVEAERRLPTFHDERRSRRLRARLDYELAAWLAQLREHHPGFILRPTVDRSRLDRAGGSGLGGLGPFVGRVSPIWREDERDGGLGVRRDAVWQGVEAQFGFGEDMPGDLEQVLERNAVSVVEQHFRIHGRVGRSGAEEAMDEALRGTPGLRWVERNRRAREHRMFESLDVAPGRDVTLTIDVDLQRIAEDVVRDLAGAREQAIVALDPQTGEILAMAGRTEVAPKDAVPESLWSAAPLYPSLNSWVGSVVKPFIALEYLEARRADPTLDPPAVFEECQRRYVLARRVLRCGGTHGMLSTRVEDALGRSCNVFFFEAAKRVGFPGILRGLTRVGWADAVIRTPLRPTSPSPGGSELAAEPRYRVEFSVNGEPGLPAGAYQAEIPGVGRYLSPRSRIVGFDGRRITPQEHAVGYGVEVPAVAVARAYAGIATGFLPKLTVVRGGPHVPRVPIVDRPGSNPSLARVRFGLRQCVTSGTAHRYLDDLAGVGLLDAAYGKTGTARVQRRDGRTLVNAWFVGFLGLDADASIVVVAVAYNVPGEIGGGGRIAAPMVGRFLRTAVESGLDRYVRVRR